MSWLLEAVALLMFVLAIAAGLGWLRARRTRDALRSELRRTRVERERVMRFSEAMLAALRAGVSRAGLYESIATAAVECVDGIRGVVYETTSDHRLRGAAVAGLFPLQNPAAGTAPAKTSRASRIETILRSETLEEGAGLVGTVARERRPLLIPHAQSDPRLRRPGDDPLAVRSLIAVPMIDGDRVLGVLAVADPVDGAPFGQASLDLLCALADHAVLALRLQASVPPAPSPPG